MTKRLLFVLCVVLLMVSCEGGDPVLAEDVCRDDSFESNDTSRIAKVVNGDTKGVTYENLVICSVDDDWYKVTVSTGECLTVAIVFTHADGDLDLTIYDSTLTKLVVSTSSTNNESVVTPSADEDDDYLVKVFGWSSETEVSYRMTVKLSTGC